VGRIVVGIDGSEHALRALAWAAAEAELRGSTLQLVHSWQFPSPVPAAEGGIAPMNIEGAVKEILDTAKSTIDASINVETETATDSPGRALIRLSEGAEMVVVGARGRGGFMGLRLGSVSQQVAHHAHCPVVIVRDGWSEES
jgi:nucleotide-binding universal stress UspA family protein